MAQYQDMRIHVEIKSLNSKALDLSLHLPSRYREREMDIRAAVAARLVRGKVDVNVWMDAMSAEESVVVNRKMLRYYHKELRNAAEEMGVAEPADWIGSLVRLPDVLMKADMHTAGDEEWSEVSKALNEALDKLSAFRLQEGEALCRLFEEKVNNIGALLRSIEPYETERVEKIRTRIEEALKNVTNNDYDHNRLEQELIYYIEKLDISEEKQRLANHLEYFIRTMTEDGPHGKKLGFIAQEMGREINTTGSKSNHAEMQNIVVRMKDELEQIKEQVLNVL